MKRFAVSGPIANTTYTVRFGYLDEATKWAETYNCDRVVDTEEWVDYICCPSCGNWFDEMQSNYEGECPSCDRKFKE